MRRPLHLLAGAVASVTTLLAISATPVGASVPGASFTRTQCETYSDSVARLYTAALDREPEQGGFDWWLEEYTQGRWTLPQMAQYFVESPEFQTKYGALDDPAYVAQIYRNVLDREPDAGGLAFWIGEMAGGMDRPTLLLRFSESPENITNSGTTQPALGDYNEGRVPGPWVCGPDLLPYLPGNDEVSGGWILLAEDRTEDMPNSDRCAEVGDLPAGTVGRLYSAALGDHVMVIAAYPFATEFGANAFMTQARDGFAACERWISGSHEVAAVVSSGTSHGDSSFFVTLTATDPNFDWRSDTTYVRVGRLVFLVSTAADKYPAAHTSAIGVVLPALEGLAG